jgi:hypothetical protein
MSVIDHATYNATAEGDDLPGLIATLHAHWGAGREVLVLFLVFVVVAQVLDYRAVKPFGRSRWLQPGSELLISTAALCATSTANWSNTLAMLRLRRADAYAAQWQPALSPPSLAYVTRLRTALSSMAVVVRLCIGLASMYDQHVDVQFIARVVDAVGAWWQGLPWWQQVLFSVAVGAFFGAWMPAAWAILSALAVDTAIDLAQEYYEKGDSFRMEEVTLGHLLAATVGALLHHTLPATVIEKLAHSAGKLLKQEMVWIGQELDRAAAQGVVAAERDFELAAIRAQRALNNAPVELSERMTRIKELVEANLRRLRGMGPPEGH